MRAAVDLAGWRLNLERLELEGYIDNEPAVRLYTKYGFVIEGKLAQLAYRDGQYVDAYAMGRRKQGLKAQGAGRKLWT